jgi:hypothetical protein
MVLQEERDRLRESDVMPLKFPHCRLDLQIGCDIKHICRLRQLAIGNPLICFREKGVGLILVLTQGAADGLASGIVADEGVVAGFAITIILLRDRYDITKSGDVLKHLDEELCFSHFLPLLMIYMRFYMHVDEIQQKPQQMRG